MVHAPTFSSPADRRLQPVYDRLAQGRVKVLSIDIFDTLLWRRVPEAHDVFLLLGAALKQEKRLAPHISALQFAELRREAELVAREKKETATGYREIRLADIYAELPDFLFAAEFKRDQRAARELACEASLMVRDDEIAALIGHAKAAGTRVMLVSDTYFCAKEIEGFFKAAGLSSGHDRLVTSCEAGRPKWRDLFPHLLKDLGIAPGDMVHVGDSAEADVMPCLRAGIPAVQYDKWSFSNRAKDREFPADKVARAALLDGAGDFGLTGLRSRLHHRGPEQHGLFWRYGAATLAPAFAAFARWIVASARDQGLRKIYGLMREGRFLKRVVEATAAAMKVDLAVEELWLSRRAVIRAAFGPDSMDLLTEAVLLTPGRTTDEIFGNLGLSRSDPGLAGFNVSQPDALLRLCQAIATDVAVRDKVFANAAKLRAQLFTGIGKVVDLSANEPLVVVDLGYMATIQAVLARLFAREGVKRPLAGWYFALNDKAMRNVLSSVDARAFMSADGYSSAATKILTRTPDVLEHACMCDAGTLSHFDQAGAPVLLPSQRAPQQIQEMTAMQDGVMAGLAAINDLLGPSDTAPAVLQRQVGRILENAMLYPTAEEATAIGGWRHEAKVDAMPTLAFNDLAFDLSRIEYGGWPALQEAGRDHVYWPAAAYRRLHERAAEAFAAAGDGYAADHLFSEPLLGALAICPDLGVGFDARREGAVPLKMNAFGRGEMNLALKAAGPEAYTRLRLRWPSARAVVRVDRVAIALTVDNQHRVIEIGQLAWSGARDLGGGEHLIEKDAEAVIDLSMHVPPQPHGLDLELRYKYLRLDPIFAKS